MSAVNTDSDETPGDGTVGDMPARVMKVDHVGLAVPSMTEAARLFVDVLGGTLLSGGDNKITGVRLMQLQFHGFKLELLQPTSDNSVLAEHLRRRGPGFHHLTMMVDDVPRTVRALAGAGLGTVGTDTSLPAWNETYLSPRDTFGALLQFVHSDLRWDVPTTSYTVDDVLAGRVMWKDYVACLERDLP